MEKITVLYRHPETHFIEPRECMAETTIPPQVWKNLNRQLLKLDSGSYFYPLDAMDAYAEAINKILNAAARIDCGKTVLTKASPTTYLTGVAYRSLYNFHLRQVRPQRELYRRVEAKTCGRGAVGEDGFDIDNYDPTQDAPSKTMCDTVGMIPEIELPAGSAMTTQQLADSLPGIPWARERARAAMQCLEDICDALIRVSTANEIIVSAFAAYIVAAANLVTAAKLIKMSKTDFYRKWPTWIAAAKKVGKNLHHRDTN